MQLIPQRNFTVVRQIGNHTDSATYYVRAVIRNAYTDAILDTLDLTDKGSQRFKKDWLVPQETSGLGGFISIVTSVYTDSGYTTKSENYSDEENTYLWANLTSNVGGGGGFSEKFDYRRLRGIVQEEIAKIPPVPAFPEIPTPKEYQMKWDEVFSLIDSVEKKIDALPTENNDDMPIMEKLDDVLGAIEAKEVTPETNLAPVLSALEDVKNEVKNNHNEHRSILDAHMTGLREELPAMIDENTGKAVGRAKFSLNMPFGMQMDGMNDRQKHQAPQEEVDHEAIAKSLQQ